MTSDPRATFMKAYTAAAALHRAGRLAEARTRYVALRKTAPRVPEVPFQLGQIALSQKDPASARDFFRDALALKPDEPAILCAAAEAAAALDDVYAARAYYDHAIAKAPKAIKPRADKALFLQRIGAFDDAETEFRRALKRAPKDGELYRLFLASKKLAKSDRLIRDMTAAWADRSVTGRSRTHLGFALAKAMEDTGQTDRVFAFLDAANKAQRAQFPFDLVARDAEIDGLIAAFKGAGFAPLSEKPDDIAPIFITGLPRSGTTLVEQIIAAHPLVQAGGEMRHGLAEAYKVLGSPGNFKPLARLSAEQVQGFADSYGSLVRKQHQFETVITDKSIQSHLIIGLLRKALPRSKVIVVRRDPRALGWSIYKNIFADGTHRYAYSLTDIADYIAGFERMIRFWRAACPEHFVEVTYEALVADPDAETRKLIAAAGLEWDPACLEFHARVGRVETLSIAQVRQPIHKRSARGWEAFAEPLAPMIDRLRERGVLPDDA